VHAIANESQPDIITELTQAVRAGAGRERHVHIILEDDRNQSHYLVRDAAHRPLQATAQWNDDVHHAAHVLVTDERDGYYADYAGNPLWHFGRALAEGFSFQGERSPFRGGERRGEPSRNLPPAAFVQFLQTHDQVGNRAFGERLSTLADEAPLRAVTACVLLGPAPPLIFMGEEFAASTPFQFFCDFSGELAGAVTRGRREEFASFARFKDPAMQATIPDPGDPATFTASKLRWDEIDRPPHSEWLAFYRKLLAIRKRELVPRLANMKSGGDFGIEDVSVLRVHWTLGDGSQLHLAANLGPAARAGVTLPAGDILYTNIDAAAATWKFPAWALAYTLQKN
jgi:maltooligosyltrehalose trehalohydrolase